MTTPAQPADLTAWLRAQLDDDELVARSASSDLWEAQRQRPDRAVYCVQGKGQLRGLPAMGVEYRADAEHIARHDPARVLAEVDAKRRILDLHEGDHECSTIRRGVDCEGATYEEIDNCTWVADGDCSTVKLLALPYADRPGYREEWRPA